MLLKIFCFAQELPRTFSFPCKGRRCLGCSMPESWAFFRGKTAQTLLKYHKKAKMDQSSRSLYRDLLPCPYTLLLLWRSPYSLHPPKRTQKAFSKDTEGYSSTTTTLPGCGMIQVHQMYRGCCSPSRDPSATLLPVLMPLALRSWIMSSVRPGQSPARRTTITAGRQKSTELRRRWESGIHRIIKVGKDIQDHQLQPSTLHCQVQH